MRQEVLVTRGDQSTTRSILVTKSTDAEHRTATPVRSRHFQSQKVEQHRPHRERMDAKVAAILECPAIETWSKRYSEDKADKKHKKRTESWIVPARPSAEVPPSAKTQRQFLDTLANTSLHLLEAHRENRDAQASSGKERRRDSAPRAHQFGTASPSARTMPRNTGEGSKRKPRRTQHLRAVHRAQPSLKTGLSQAQRGTSGARGLLCGLQK